jgi:Spy/CpxP family protein refolding chaperone
MNMAKYFGWMLTAALFCVPAAAVDGQSDEKPHDRQARPSHDNRGQEQRWKWWINPDDRKEFGITDQQSAQIDQIWESYAPAARTRNRELEKLEEALSKTIKEGTVDVASLTQQVTRVEKLRAEQITNRTVMLYRIMQVLTPDQRPRIEALLARRAEARRRQQAERDKDKTEATR